jgi:hypothetical protein
VRHTRTVRVTVIGRCRRLLAGARDPAGADGTGALLASSGMHHAGRRTHGRDARALPAAGARLALAASVALASLVACFALVGASGVSVAPAAGTSEKRGALTLLCGFSHAAPDDPIVAPGRPGGSHQHQFFGNRRLDARTNGKTITKGTTTCDERRDKSAYWVPALLENGREVKARGMRVVYERPARSPRVRAFPAGLRVVIGDARATAAQREVTWGCSGTRIRGRALPATCPVGSRVRVEVRFPSCWDGKRLDRPDHRSHLASLVRVRVRGVTRSACPRSHPVALPRLVLTGLWATRGTGDLALSSGSGFTGHADFFNGWDAAQQRRLVARCLNAGRSCRGSTRATGAPGPGNY